MSDSVCFTLQQIWVKFKNAENSPLQLIRTLCSIFPVIYTKGLEKANFLRQFHTDVREIDCTISCNDNDCDISCVLPQHNDVNSKCALRSALVYKRGLKLKDSVITV